MRIYGKCISDPKVKLEDPTRCIVSVQSRIWAISPYQCTRPRTCGDGEERLYCKQHYKMGPVFLSTAVPPDEEVIK